MFRHTHLFQAKNDSSLRNIFWIFPNKFKKKSKQGQGRKDL